MAGPLASDLRGDDLVTLIAVSVCDSAECHTAHSAELHPGDPEVPGPRGVTWHPVTAGTQGWHLEDAENNS